MNAYQRPWNEVVQELGSDSERGLTSSQVSEQQRLYGPNIIPERAERGWLGVFFDQFKDPLIYLLLIAAVIIFFVSEHRFDAFIISGILTFNAIIGTWQEGRTRSIMRSLRHFEKSTTVVVRNGQKDLVEDCALVPGDIIFLLEGQRIPADARVIESNNLLVDEAVLTGESQGVRKQIMPLATNHSHGGQTVSAPDQQHSEASTASLDELPHGELSLGDQVNMLFSGTHVLAGTGKAIVVATGTDTVIGAMQSAIEEADTDMPLKQELKRLSHWLLLFVLITCVFIFAFGVFLGNPIRDLLVMTVALFICVVPEGLPVVLTLALVNGVYRLAQQGVLVKRMQAVEGLGRTDAIVIDKTGTLTRNEMMVTRLVTPEHDVEVGGQGYYATGVLCEKGRPETAFKLDDAAIKIGRAASLLNSSEITYDEVRQLFTIKGDPTEAALFVVSKKMGLNKDDLVVQYTKLYEIPFDPALRYHAGFYAHDGKGVCFIIGSCEVIAKGAVGVGSAGHVFPLQAAYEKLLLEGLRVLAVATRSFILPEREPEDPFSFYSALTTTELEVLGVVGLADAMRPDVADVIALARNAGLQVVMATGDHKKTALYVARQVGIFKEGDKALDGTEFRALTHEDAKQLINTVTVYARFDPLDKVKIVSLFHEQKKLVAMTGDGVNDVPSLMAADLGIAMGGIGTEVAKEAADIVLLNDSFASIIKAIEQGRHIFYTLRRVVLYFFVTNMGEIVMVLFALFARLPLPITAAQILWLNLITDGFLDMALSTEPKEEDLLLQPGWLAEKKRLIDWSLLVSVATIAVPMGLMAMGVFIYYYKQDIVLARTMTLVTMAMAQWFNAWNCRSETKSIASLSFFGNPWLLVATSFVLLLQLALIYVPFMQKLFVTVPLTLPQWGLAVIVSVPVILIDEVRKVFIRRSQRRSV